MEMQTSSTLLSWITFTPLIGMAGIILMLALRPVLKLSQGAVDNASRALTIAASLPSFILAFFLWRGFNPSNTGVQFVHRFVWIKAFNVEYFMGADGLSVTMIMLTALVSMIAVIASMPWGIKDDDDHGHGHGAVAHAIHFSKRQVPGFMALLLLLETGMFGVFCALDFFLFYVFWELMLLPMYFLIGIWGGPRREYAAIKFFLYTLAGSVLMLLAMIALYLASEPTTLVDGSAAAHTFNLIKLAAQSSKLELMPAILGMPFAKVLWVFMFIAFAVKVPMFPFHTWLPDAHVEAPTPISVILAGVLLKMGPYGMLRMNWAILPDATVWAQWAVAAFGMINIVYAAFVCMAQKDLKKLIAYSSVSHMGFVLLGMAAFTPQGITGAVYQMWTHGVVSAALFLIAGVIYDRAHHRDIEGFGGLAKQLPEYAAMTGLAFMASLGLPGLVGFISEALVFLGSFPVFKVFTIISATSVVITAAYYLWTMQRMFLGKLNQKYAGFSDLNFRERLVLYPLAALIVVLGFYPMPMLELINTTLHAFIRPFAVKTGLMAGL